MIKLVSVQTVEAEKLTMLSKLAAGLDRLSRVPDEDLGLALSSVEWVQRVEAKGDGSFLVELVFGELHPMYVTMRIV